MIVVKRLLSYILLFTLAINSFTLHGSQSNSWMNYISNSFVGLRNYIGQSIVQHKKLVIGGSLLVGGVATYYLARKYSSYQQAMKPLMLEAIRNYEATIKLPEEKNNFLLSRELINKTKPNDTPLADQIFIKHLIPYYYKTSMHIDLENWKLIETIKFKDLTATITINPNLSYNILTQDVTNWIKNNIKQLIGDSRQLIGNTDPADREKFFTKYYRIKQYSNPVNFLNGISEFNKKKAAATLYFYHSISSSDSANSDYLFFAKLCLNDNPYGIPQILKGGNPLVCFFIEGNPNPYCIGNMETLIDESWNELNYSSNNPSAFYGDLYIQPEIKKEQALKVLGLPSDATEEQIKKAFRTKSSSVHPDRASKDEEKNATARFNEFSAAQEFLMNPTQEKPALIP